MTPERVRAMVTAMQNAGESDDSIRQALEMARSQEKPAVKPDGVLTPEEWAKQRPAALDAGEADAMFEAQRTGRAAPGVADRIQSLFGMDPAMRAQMNLRTNPGYMKERARAGDEAAKIVSSGQDIEKAGQTIGTGFVAGGLGAHVGGKLLPMAGGVVGRVLAGAGGGAVGGATAGGVEGLADTGDPVEAAKRAGIGGLVGAGAGGTLTAAGELAGAVSRAVRANPYIGRYVAARQNGVYEQPEMKSLPPGRQGMQEAADTTVDKIAGRETQLADEAEKAWNLVGADPAVLEKPVDTKVIRQRLEAGRARNLNPDTGRPINSTIDSAYQRALDDLPGAPGGVEPTLLDQATVGGTLKMRQALKRAAAFDSHEPTPEQLAARDVYHTFRAAVRDASPDLAEADDAFAAHSRAAERRADLVGVDLTNADPGKKETAAARLGRIGDDNVPGLRVQRRLAELEQSDPEIGAAINWLADKKAKEAVRFGAPHMPTHLSAATLLAGIPRAVGQNARALGAHVVDPLSLALSRNLSPGALRAPAFIPGLLEAYRRRAEAEQ